MSANTNYLKIFTDGETVKANETNDNNQYLLNRIDENAQNLLQYLQTEIEQLQGNFILPGFIIGLPFDTIPVGYLKCDGSSLLIADYPDLYNAIGTIYGQEDSTQFNLPDFRGKFLRGAGGSSATIGTLQQYKHPIVTVPATGWARKSTLPGVHNAITAGTLVVGSGQKETSENLESLREVSEDKQASVSGELYPDNYALHWIIKY